MKIIILIFFISIPFLISAQEVDLSFLTPALGQLSFGPPLNKPCPDLFQTELELFEEVPKDNLESRMELDKARIIHGSYFYLGLRNDLFAFPITTIRNQRIYLIDMGETHGLKFEMGMRLQNNKQAVLSYDTRLFTDLIKAYGQLKPPHKAILRKQSFTTETQVLASFNNYLSNDSLLYSIGLGIIDYDSKNSDNPLLASTQQKALHNYADSLIDIKNQTSQNILNGYHYIVQFQIGKEYNPSEKVTIMSYGKLQLSPSRLLDYLTTGVRISKDFNLGEDLTAEIAFDLPATMHLTKSGIPNFFMIPTFSSSIRYMRAELGFSMEQPFGDWSRNIPQNRPREHKDVPGVPASDLGEMGTIYFKIYN